MKRETMKALKDKIKAKAGTDKYHAKGIVRSLFKNGRICGFSFLELLYWINDSGFFI